MALPLPVFVCQPWRMGAARLCGHSAKACCRLASLLRPPCPALTLVVSAAPRVCTGPGVGEAGPSAGPHVLCVSAQGGALSAFTVGCLGREIRLAAGFCVTPVTPG